MNSSSLSLQEGKFFIVNQYDRPCERLIAQLRDGKLHYIGHGLADDKIYRGMSADSAVPVEDFGIRISVENGTLHGIQTGDSLAVYSNGKSRKWQGASSFSMPLPGARTLKAPLKQPETDMSNPDLFDNLYLYCFSTAYEEGGTDIFLFHSRRIGSDELQGIFEDGMAESIAAIYGKDDTDQYDFATSNLDDVISIHSDIFKEVMSMKGFIPLPKLEASSCFYALSSIVPNPNRRETAKHNATMEVREKLKEFYPDVYAGMEAEAAKEQLKYEEARRELLRTKDLPETSTEKDGDACR